MHSDSNPSYPHPSSSSSSSSSSFSAKTSDPDLLQDPKDPQDPKDDAADITTASPPFDTSLPPTAPCLSFTTATGVTATTPHKRGREPSSMTDPSEAARYTPPREMFRQSTAVIDSDDLVSLPSEDSLIESELDIHIENASYIKQQLGQSMPNGYPVDSELDNLGHQLSIHSPEKSVLASMDQEQEFFGQNSPRPGSGVDMTRSSSECEGDNQDEEQQEQEQGIETQPPFDQQNNIILNLSRTRLEEGAPWYLVNNAWYARFRRYCTKMARGQEVDHPGSIDNSILFLGDGLRADIQNSVTLLPQEAWDLLVSWYGTSTAPILRRVINTASAEAPNLIIDFYPPVFALYKVVEAGSANGMMFSMNEPETLEVPRSTKFGDLRSALISRMEATGPGPARLWAVPAHTSPIFDGNTIEADAIIPSGATCLDGVDDEAAIAEIPELNNCKALVVEMAADGLYPVPYTAPASEPIVSFALPRNLHSPRANALAATAQGQAANGLCGLSNLGNTCFMNSALQCLSNTPDLTRYVLAGAWRDELNLDNPLGMGGEVARAYANVIDKLWNGNSKVFSPREFKMTIGRFAPSFTGYHQHDSQELLAFLLDGLHEDLNRIIKKPYTEVPDSNGRPDDEVANDCWQIHKARNDSIIVDLFQGQYKSTLVCPECDKVSVTFDPFMYLSLPLPINKMWIGTITYVPYDPRKPLVDIRLQLPKGSTMRQLKEKIADIMGTQANHLFAAEVFSHRFYKSHDNADAVDELGEGDKNFVYELPVPDFTNAPEHVVFPVFSMMEPTATYGRPAACGHPMMVCVTKEEAKNPDAVYRAIVRQATRYTTMNLYEDDFAGEGPDQQELSDCTNDGEENMDVRMFSSADDANERLPKSGLFQLFVYSPPLTLPSRYHHRSLSRATPYAPVSTPSLSEMVDMYQRVIPKELNMAEELEPFMAYPSNGSLMRGDDELEVQHNNGAFSRPDSPSSPSDSSESGQPPVPPQDEDELSEDDDLATFRQPTGLAVKLSKAEKPRPERVQESEPAVRPGEMVYCVWDRSMESAISTPERRYRSYRSMDEDESQEPGVKVLWDERGPIVVDPALAEELSKAKKGRKIITLEDCLTEYTKEEELGEEDLWYCPNCKKHQQATKKLDIWRLPDILVVHLKRFSHTRAWRDKIDAMVDFPINGLDLSGKALKEEDGDENVYDLFGVSNHMGGLGGGHYTAYAKNEKLGRWFNFDDSHVSPVGDEESIKSSSAYLLFYRRRNAVVREYEQRPAEALASTDTDTVGSYMMSMSAPSLRDRKDDEEEYGWGTPSTGPFRDMAAVHEMESDMDELPPYSAMIGPSGLASPTSSFSGRQAFISDPMQGEARLLDEDDAEVEDSAATEILSGYEGSHDTTGHSPDLSTCASDGSNPGTANVSPGYSPAGLASPISSYPPKHLPVDTQPVLSIISQEGGRIDDNQEMEEADNEYPYGSVGTGAGIPTPMTEAGDEAEGEEGERDGVNMVAGWQHAASSS
ncbi:CSN-associated deubiquitinating enzyme Ubp12 [Mortierella sp. GBA30]|nr:CSN-associated deubiquitinating enzyme Ubp12 [Mortierella sp. GBA30]